MLPEIGMQHSLVFDQNCLVWKGNSSKTKILPKKNLKSNIFMGKLSEKVPSVLKILRTCPRFPIKVDLNWSNNVPKW